MWIITLYIQLTFVCSVHTIPEGGAQHHIYVGSMQSPVSAFVFISGNIFIQQNSSRSCRRKIPYVGSLMDHAAPSGY